MKKYKIFVIFHDTLNLEYYNESILENLVFVNVRNDNTNVYSGLNIINLHDFKEFTPIGKYYAESEVIYNVFKNQYLIDDVEYVGFLHHDIDCTPLSNNVIQNQLSKNQLISFETHILRDDYNRNILMDLNKPNVLRGKGSNCYDTMFKDFNSFYKTDFSIQKFHDRKDEIILCSCFLTQKEIFLKLMEFGSNIIESKKLNKFDTKHKYRIQGGLMERYYATWFLLKNIPFTTYFLEHKFHETNKQNTVLNKLIRKIKSLI